MRWDGMGVSSLLSLFSRFSLFLLGVLTKTLLYFVIIHLAYIIRRIRAVVVQGESHIIHPPSSIHTLALFLIHTRHISSRPPAAIAGDVA
jgi:hypothetical protein